MYMKRISIAIVFFLSLVSNLLAYTSLHVTDPRNGGLWAQGIISKASVIITPKADYLLYEMELELGVGKISHTNTYDSLEITCNFDLPAGAYITNASLLIGNEWITAEIMPRKEAHAIYEGFVKRRIDPLIVYKNYGDSYMFKIFPIAATQKRTMRLTYAMPIVSTNGFESAGLLTDLFKASENVVDVKVLLKKSTEFPNPIIGTIPFQDSNEHADYVEAIVPSNAMSYISSSKKTEAIRFSTSTNNTEITYSLSFKPHEVFALEDPKKFIFIIDNDPQIIQDTIFTYNYTESGYVRQFNKTRTIQPLANNILYTQIKNMLANTKVGDMCKIYLKNNGVYITDWIHITPETIETLIQTLSANDDSYKANIKELLFAAKTDIEQENTVAILLSNNKQMVYKSYDEIQTEAAHIAFELNMSKPINVWNISSFYDNENGLSFYNGFVSELSNVLYPSQRYYYYQMYYLSDFVDNFNRIQINNTSKILLLNVSTRSDIGVIFDKYASTTKNIIPTTTYTELGKITGGNKFIADISFLYKGKRYVGTFEFPIDTSQNTLLEDAWAVKMVDELNSIYSAEATAEAEKISTENAILTQNTAMLAIEPGVEITPCYNCPDWNNTRWVLNDILVPFETGVFASSVSYYGGYDSYSYEEGFNDGILFSEQAIETENANSYDNGYAAGYADGIFNCNAAEQKDSDLEAYPTEFTTELQVIVYSNKQQIVEVYTASGVFVESFAITKVKELEQSNSLMFGLPSGTYILKTTIDGKVSYATVFKK
ncbi:MAG: Vault protein inter-alpha-trypsin [Bacteroidetes bacterium ADurb.Bin217]|nr:MAG: Vault protein inter-alpha-trypsin [Bacteroidetes bacterium ADurb.Bin217]